MAAFSFVHLLLLLTTVAIPLFVAYWLVRLGVRHGMQDVQRAESRRSGMVPPPS